MAKRSSSGTSWSTQREEYVETIHHLIAKNNAPAKTNDIAALLDVAAPSVTEMLQKLSEEGLVTYKRYYGVTFTEKGRQMAVKIRRRQGLLESFLVSVLNFDCEAAHDEACRLEHGVSDVVLERLCILMNHPKSCPDGHPIEPGECCLKGASAPPTPISKEKRF